MIPMWIFASIIFAIGVYMIWSVHKQEQAIAASNGGFSSLINSLLGPVLAVVGLSI